MLFVLCCRILGWKKCGVITLYRNWERKLESSYHNPAGNQTETYIHVFILNWHRFWTTRDTDTVRLKFEWYHLSHISKVTHSKTCIQCKTLTKPFSLCNAPRHRIPFPLLYTHRQVYLPTCLSPPTVTGTIMGPTFPSHTDPQLTFCHTQAAPHLISESIRVYVTLTAPPSYVPTSSAQCFIYTVLDYYVKFAPLGGPLLCYIFLQFPKTEVILTFLGFPGHHLLSKVHN